MAVASPQIRLWGYPSTLGLVKFDALAEMIFDDPDWVGVARTSFADHHFDAISIGALNYNDTADKHRLLIGGAGGED